MTNRSVTKKLKDPQPMPFERASHLLNPLRKLILSPKKLAGRLDLRQDSRVLELGPGPGFFSPEVARRISSGILVLVDIQQEMLDMAKKRIESMQINNVQYIKGDASSLPFDCDYFDVVFMVSVLGEVPDQNKCLLEINRVLRPHGLLSISEQPGDPDFIAMPDLQKRVEKAGFTLDITYGFARNYTVNFRKIS